MADTDTVRADVQRPQIPQQFQGPRPNMNAPQIGVRPPPPGGPAPLRRADSKGNMQVNQPPRAPGIIPNQPIRPPPPPGQQGPQGPPNWTGPPNLQNQQPNRPPFPFVPPGQGLPGRPPFPRTPGQHPVTAPNQPPLRPPMPQQQPPLRQGAPQINRPTQESKSRSNSIHPNEDSKSRSNSIHPNEDSKSRSNSIYQNDESKSRSNSIHPNEDSKSRSNSIFQNDESKSRSNSIFPNDDNKSRSNSIFANNDDDDDDVVIGRATTPQKSGQESMKNGTDEKGNAEKPRVQRLASRGAINVPQKLTQPEGAESRGVSRPGSPTGNRRKSTYSNPPPDGTNRPTTEGPPSMKKEPTAIDLKAETPGQPEQQEGFRRATDRRKSTFTAVDRRKSTMMMMEPDNDSGVDESTQGNDRNGPESPGSPLKSPTKTTPSRPESATPSIKSSKSRSTSRQRLLLKTPEPEPVKKVPMNKIQVGNAPSPNLKAIKSKIGSLGNASYKPGGGNVKIESKRIDVRAAPKIENKNENYVPRGGDKKIVSTKLQWSAKSKIGSLENAHHKPGGGDKKIETLKHEFKDKAKPKIGSKDNVKHAPGGGDIKIQTHKIEIKAHSKIGSLDNVKYKPGGGDKKIFDDKEYLKNIEHPVALTSPSQSPTPSAMTTSSGADENLNQQQS